MSFQKEFKKIAKKCCIFQKNMLRYSLLSGCGSVGRVRGLGPWGRRFESSHPDQRGCGGTGRRARLRI